MPWKVKQAGDKWETVNKLTGRVMGTHPSKEKAEAQMRALYANVPESRNLAEKESDIVWVTVNKRRIPIKAKFLKKQGDKHEKKVAEIVRKEHAKIRREEFADNIRGFITDPEVRHDALVLGGMLIAGLLIHKSVKKTAFAKQAKIAEGKVMELRKAVLAKQAKRTTDMIADIERAQGKMPVEQFVGKTLEKGDKYFEKLHGMNKTDIKKSIVFKNKDIKVIPRKGERVVEGQIVSKGNKALEKQIKVKGEKAPKEKLAPEVKLKPEKSAKVPKKEPAYTGKGYDEEMRKLRAAKAKHEAEYTTPEKSAKVPKEKKVAPAPKEELVPPAIEAPESKAGVEKAKEALKKAHKERGTLENPKVLRSTGMSKSQASTKAHTDAFKSFRETIEAEKAKIKAEADEVLKRASKLPDGELFDAHLEHNKILNDKIKDIEKKFVPKVQEATSKRRHNDLGKLEDELKTLTKRPEMPKMAGEGPKAEVKGNAPVEKTLEVKKRGRPKKEVSVAQKPAITEGTIVKKAAKEPSKKEKSPEEIDKMVADAEKNNLLPQISKKTGPPATKPPEKVKVVPEKEPVIVKKGNIYDEKLTVQRNQLKNLEQSHKEWDTVKGLSPETIASRKRNTQSAIDEKKKMIADLEKQRDEFLKS